VNDALAVGVIQGGGHIADTLRRIQQGQRPAPHDLFGGPGLHIAHRQISNLALVDKVVDGDDVGMFEAGDDSGFLSEAPDDGGVLRVGLRQDFDGDESFQPRLVSDVNRRHAAGADLFEDMMRSEDRAAEDAHGSVL
jgi:hypothetical protein